jgi:hypothetical protein
LGAEEIFARFFYRVFELPLLQNAQKRDKKIEPNNRGRKEKKTDGKKNIFVMSQMDFFGKKIRVFELPLLRNAQKTR